MDSTTKMQVNEILERGWYKESQTLGAGGWSQIPNDWKHYGLFGFQESSYPGEDDWYWENFGYITAKDDKTAVKAFRELFRLDEILDWEIQERIVEYRIVDVSNKENENEYFQH